MTHDNDDLPFDKSPLMSPDEIANREMPKDVAEWWAGLKLAGSFTMLLERVSKSNGIEALPPYQNRLPTQTEIGTDYGPGKYRLTAVYKNPNWEKGDLTKPGPWFDLSEDGYESLYLESQQKKRDKLNAKSGSKQVLQVPDNSLRDIAPLIQVLAHALKPQQVIHQPVPPPPPPQDNSILVALIGMMSTQAQKSQELMMQMFATMMNKNNSGSSEDRIFGLIEKIVTAKEQLLPTPKEESSTFDRLMDGIGQMLPHIGTFLSMPRMMQNNIAPGLIASQPPEVQQGIQLLKSNADFKRRFAEKITEVYGDGAKEILEVVETIAPESP